MKRALFVELLGGIGDLIFALPALEALACADPTTRWDVVTFAPGGELLIDDPRVHEVFFARREAPGCGEDVASILAAHHYDLVVSDTRHGNIPELIEVSGVPRTVTQLWTGAGPDEPIARLFLRRLREEGLIDPRQPDPPARVHLADLDRRTAAATWASLGVSPRTAVVLNPHAGMAIKRWPREGFVWLGRTLGKLGWNVVVLAGEDGAEAERIATALTRAWVLPRLALRPTAACLEGVALVVSADSGIAHLASAVSAAVVGIYGPTWAGRYGAASPAVNLQSPFDCEERRPMNFTRQRCWYTGRCIFPGKASCTADVTPEAVGVAALILLARQPSDANLAPRSASARGALSRPRATPTRGGSGG